MLHKLIDMSSNKRRKLITLLLLFIIICSLFCTGMTWADQNLPAAEFEKLDLFEELNSIDDFDWSDYPYDSSGIIASPEIFNVVEYCYSFDKSKRGNYGLYVYFYNPQNLKISHRMGQNKLTLAVAWDDKDKAISYESFQLKFISTIESGKYANLFYKFKVVDHKSADGKYIHERVRSSDRHYDIGEIQLLTEGEQNATAYTVGATYVYSGYAKGYGANEKDDSTLEWTVVNNEVVEIKSEDIGSTSWIFDGFNSKGENHHDCINSVYFSVPDYILERYGNLQKVKFETYRYRTSPIIVIKQGYEQSLLSDLKNARSLANNLDNWLAWGYNSGTEENPYGSYDATYGFVFTGVESPVSNNRVFHLPYIFEKEYESFSNVIGSSELLSYITSYNSSNFSGYLPHRELTKDLFKGTFDNGIKEGFWSPPEIDAKDKKSLTAYNWSDGWNEFWGELFGKKPDISNDYDIYPISLIDSDRINDDNYLDELYIHPDDRNGSYDDPKFKQKMAIAKIKERSMYMFHFAVSDYYSTSLYSVDPVLNGQGAKVEKLNAFVAQTTAYLDFDIIQLTFNQDGKMTVIPVVMSPIDVISGIRAPSIPPSLKDIAEKILKVIVAVLCLVLLIILVVLLAKVISNLLDKNSNRKINKNLSQLVKTYKKSEKKARGKPKSKNDDSFYIEMSDKNRNNRNSS